MPGRHAALTAETSIQTTACRKACRKTFAGLKDHGADAFALLKDVRGG